MEKMPRHFIPLCRGEASEVIGCHFLLVTSFGARVYAVATRKQSHVIEFPPTQPPELSSQSCHSTFFYGIQNHYSLSPEGPKIMII